MPERLCENPKINVAADLQPAKIFKTQPKEGV